MNHRSECLVFRTVKKVPLSLVRIEQIACSTLRVLKISGSLSVHCIGDRRMRRMNFQYRGKDRTTDVLSFGLYEGESSRAQGNELGDIFICVPQIIRQARRFSVSTKEEFIRMLVHGILHLLGYDHETSSDATRMFELQEKLLIQLN